VATTDVRGSARLAAASRAAGGAPSRRQRRERAIRRLQTVLARLTPFVLSQRVWNHVKETADAFDAVTA
jgi:hypothetical protein